MPAPSTSLATLRPDLAGSFQEFDLEMQAAGFIGTRVMPIIDVARQSGSFGKIPIEELLENRQTRRAPGAGYSRGEWTFTRQAYACEEHGAEEPIDDREAEMYMDYFDVEQISTSRARSVVLRNAEQRIADAVFNTTTWTGTALTTAVSVTWATAATAKPLDDVEAAVQKVYDNSGLWPNALIINRKVFRNLRNVTQIIDRIKYAGITDPRAGAITIEAMSQVFDLDQIIVADVTKNTANEAKAATLAPIWANANAMVCRVATSQDIREPCIGRTFHWAADGSLPQGLVETYREEAVRGDVVRVRHDVDELVLYVEAGHLLTNIT